MKQFWYFILLFLIISGSACKKPKPVGTEPVNPADTINYDGYNLNLSIKNMVGDKDMVFQTSLDSGETYYNNKGEDFRIKRFVYYISNLKLISVQGDTLSLDPAYHIIDAAQGIYNITFKTKKADYKELILLIGVDSARNVSGIQTGALDPFLGAFLGLEYRLCYGHAGRQQQPFLIRYFFFHIGGYSGEYNAVVPVSIKFDRPFATADKNTDLLLITDVQKWFDGPHQFSIEEQSFIMTIGEDSKNLSENYSKMFVKYEIQ